MEIQELALYKHYANLIRQEQGAREPSTITTTTLDALSTKFRAFFFDGFGTLYNLQDPHPGAAKALQYLRDQGCALRLITNAASRPPQHLQKHLNTLGIHFSEDEIICSGALLAEENVRLKIQSAFHLGRSEAEPLLRNAGIESSAQPSEPTVIISSGQPGNQPENLKALEILRQPYARLVVLNPDGWAPRWEGGRIAVSGSLAWELVQATGCQCEFLGKPFGTIFRKALSSLPLQQSPAIMIGDTLGTDILGAQSQGIATALILGGNTSMEQLPADENALQTWPDYYLDPRYLS